MPSRTTKRSTSFISGDKTANSRGGKNNSALAFNQGAFEAYNSGQINLQTEGGNSDQGKRLYVKGSQEHTIQSVSSVQSQGRGNSKMRNAANSKQPNTHQSPVKAGSMMQQSSSPTTAQTKMRSKSSNKRAPMPLPEGQMVSSSK